MATKLPHPLPPIMLYYLTMFRPEKTMLSWGKALHLTKYLAALAAAGNHRTYQPPEPDDGMSEIMRRALAQQEKEQ